MKILKPSSTEIHYQILFDKHFGKGVWKKFKKNYDPNFIVFRINKSFESYLSETSVCNLISSAFNWAYSPECHDYWEKINEKWRNI